MKILSKRARLDINLAESALDYIDVPKLVETIKKVCPFTDAANAKPNYFAGGYDPTCITEDFYFVNTSTGQSRAEYIEQAREDVGYDKVREELIRCKDDPAYFIANYCQVPHPTLGSVRLDLENRGYQGALIQHLVAQRGVIVKHPRQGGITTIMLAYALWMACFKNNQSILLGAVNHAQAQELRSKVNFMYEKLPVWLRPETKYSNKLSLQLDSGSAIHCQVISDHFGRGFSFSLCYMDSFAFVKPEIQEYVWDCIAPGLSTGGKLVVASTPDTTNTCFHSLWMNAVEGVGPLVPFSVQFEELPQSVVIHADNLKNLLGEAAFRRDYLGEFVQSVEVDLLDRVTGIVPSERPPCFIQELPSPEERDLGCMGTPLEIRPGRVIR